MPNKNFERIFVIIGNYDCDDIADELDCIFEEYESVTVADLMEVCGIKTTVRSSFYGWNGPNFGYICYEIPKGLVFCFNEPPKHMDTL